MIWGVNDIHSFDMEYFKEFSNMSDLMENLGLVNQDLIYLVQKSLNLSSILASKVSILQQNVKQSPVLNLTSVIELDAN